MTTESVTLELLNPRGEIEPPPVFIPSSRVNDLAGKRIGLYSNGKQGVDNLYTVIEELLNEKYPGITITRLTGAFEIRDDEAGTFASELDTFIYAVGD